MRLFVLLALIFFAASTHVTVEFTGMVNRVDIWGSVAKVRLCNSQDRCENYWIHLSNSNAQAVLSVWLTAKVSGAALSIQGYNDRPEKHPYSGASRFYGMFTR